MAGDVETVHVAQPAMNLGCLKDWRQASETALNYT